MAKKKTSPSAPKADQKDRTPSSTKELVRHRMGRELERHEMETVSALDSFFKHNQDNEFVYQSSMNPLLGGGKIWSWERYELWPKKPANAWEAWLYVFNWAEARGAALPPVLRDITRREEVNALVANWEHEKAIVHWRKWLHTEHSRQAANPPELREIRAVVETGQLFLEWRDDPAGAFKPLKPAQFSEWHRAWQLGELSLERKCLNLWSEFAHAAHQGCSFRFTEARAIGLLNSLFRTPNLEASVVNPDRQPFRRSEERLRWHSANAEGDYHFRLVRPDGSVPPPPLIALDGNPALYVTADEIFESDAFHGLSAEPARPAIIPAAAMETTEGVALIERLQVPLRAELASRVRRISARVEFRCALVEKYGEEQLQVRLLADLGDEMQEEFRTSAWQVLRKRKTKDGTILRLDQSLKKPAAQALERLRLEWMGTKWSKIIGKKFPEQWVDWLADLPAGIELTLDPMLASLRERPVKVTVTLEVEEAGIDWFDLRVELGVTDTELSTEEIQMLHDAKGGFVRLGAKGWRRLEYQLSPEEEERLADLGLNARDLSGEKQRIHALQLAGKSARQLLGPERAEQMRRRAAEIKTRVAPEIPAAMRAELRPYQLEGFHFLAYLSANRFGGILADDMGLGKTVQTLTWLAWLREQPGAGPKPVLVVCPKSVADTWRSETARFYPKASVRVFRPSEEISLTEAIREANIIVINYAQLRAIANDIVRVEWLAVILDEAQYIKNPTSQTFQAACALKAEHRLALSGTPIENRLLDLWSIMAFAMPGALGTRAGFNRSFDQKGDPYARRRLAARVRPFVLRRTKAEVATDLPERIEEDVFCEMEGSQATLYRAELKRARLALLKIKTATDLDAARFSVLTSLLRLRQICCHPALIKANEKESGSTKFAALVDLLEPMMEEGHKVLIFSQFVEMIALLQAEVTARGWPVFVLTGQTEERGALVEKFQTSTGAGIFLISLRAGGFGLNLTAASYVVLCDPWWNPAVENQAIDRTHRIGQTNRVVAYRLIVKDSIEEKIRALQHRKSALAADILGEESFARALTLDDFRFLIGEEKAGEPAEPTAPR